jgi:predicted NACHT family NTPase
LGTSACRRAWGKVILTCRTEHFPEAQEGRELLMAKLQASTAAWTGRPPQFEVLELKQFDDSQIRQALSYRADSEAVSRVMTHPSLRDLARRPVMTELILEALPDVEAGKPVDLSRIYLYAVRRKIERDIKEERTFTSLADKIYFLCELSWEMLSTHRMSLNSRLFPDRLRRLFGYVVQEQKDLDHWHYDMMGQTMLIRNSDGDYTPAHRSLLEFFVAYKFAAEMGVLVDDFVEPAKEQSHLDMSSVAQKYTWSHYFFREVLDNGEIKRTAPLKSFVRESFRELALTVGKEPIAPAVLTLLSGMVNSSRLHALLKATRHCEHSDVLYTGGNAATLINQVTGKFEETDLPGANLFGADLMGCDLSTVNLSAATLRHVNFRRANL